MHKISIVQRGFGALGYTMQLPLEDRYLMTRTDLLGQLAVLLGGRTAEEIAFGEISTGAQNDLQRATDIARAMVTEFGMSDLVGLVNHNGHKRNPFLETPFIQERGAYAEQTALLIDTEVKRILTESHAEARRVLAGASLGARRSLGQAARSRSRGIGGAARAPGSAAPEGRRGTPGGNPSGVSLIGSAHDRRQPSAIYNPSSGGLVLLP